MNSPPPARVLSGRVLVDGQEVRQVKPGSAIEVAPGQPAAIELSDGSRATFEPHSRAVLHGRQQALRQVVELTQGSGAFAVRKNADGFVVRTDVGRVRVLGTEFTVELKPDQPEKGTNMKTAHALLAVAVLSGMVEVQVGDQTWQLGPGDNRVFAKESEKPRPKKFSGQLTQVNSGSITIGGRGDRGEWSRELTVDSSTKVLIETDQMESVPGEGGTTKQRPKLQEGALGDLKVGQKVDGTCDQANKVLTIVIRRQKPPKREGGEGNRAVAPRAVAPRVKESERARVAVPPTPRIKESERPRAAAPAPTVPRIKESERARTPAPSTPPKLKESR